VIFIGPVDGGAVDGLAAGGGAVLPPHAVIDDTTDDAKPIIASRIAMLTHVILRASG
jgi:hypothetical protein